MGELDRKQEKREQAFQAMKIEIEEIAGVSKKNNTEIKVNVNQQKNTISELIEKVDLFQMLLKHAEQNRMEKYYT